MNNAALHERVEMRTLDNGLRICYLPKSGFSKTFAILAANYGSVDQSFTLAGRRYDMPAGVAHFLEHKMFEDEDGNALQKFAKTGASPNAFTGQDMTAYHFSCTERFAENLEILLKFVFTPYFTMENVAKERGIIAQEIRMMDDTPVWRTYTGLFRGLFHEHPARVPIAGSVESIAEITPEVLYTCHRAFYSPRNMALIVCGNADLSDICSMAARYSPKDAATIGERHYGKRRDAVAAPLVRQEMSVSQPQMFLGIKDKPLEEGESRLRRRILGELGVSLLCGDNAPLFAELYERRLINRNFDGDYKIIPEGATALFSGESRDPDTVRGSIEQEIARLAANGIDAARFSRTKKALYGLYLRVLDQPEEYARQQAEAVFAGENYLDFAVLFDTICEEDVRILFARWAQQDRSSLSVTEPKLTKEECTV